jgi:pimeloyl-ACP methyl ester carboxylesterase
VVLVLDAEVVRQLVQDRDPDLIGQVVRIGEVRLEREAEDEDPVRLRDPVGAPFVERHTLVQAIQDLVGTKPVLAQLLRGGLVRDHHRDVIERRPKRGGDGCDRAVDQEVEPLVVCGVRTPRREPGSSTTLDHGVRMLAAMTHRLDPVPDGLVPIELDPAAAPGADPGARPDGFMVAGADARLHFLDWGEPDAPAAVGDPLIAGGQGEPPGVLLMPGLLQPAWSWAPVARRLRAARHTVIADLRGQGLSDASPDGYDLDTLAGDAVAVAAGAGLLAGRVGNDATYGDARIIVAGHGFGATVAAAAAARLGARCAGLVLVDGGWERLEETTNLDVDEFLRALDEPPEVLRSMDAWLADRRGFDPASWDEDQERSAREAVVETAAGRVVRTVRPFVVDALVRTMFGYEPASVLATIDAPITALVALAGGDAAVRLAELERVGLARMEAGRPPIRVATFPVDAHNLMRYRPGEVASAILGAPA